MKKKPVVVDLFCGAGGESQGIHWAAEKNGVDIEMFSINHWERAIETHSKNFPQYEAICKDILDLDPLRVVPQRDVELLWASPACTHFSVARGGKPMDEQSRCTPFTVGDWLEKLNVKRFIIENVPEFTSWGPLGDDMRPIQDAKGDTFMAYIQLIKSLGYDVDWKVINAADFGAPTTRRRLFIQGVKKGSGKRLMWPEATHAAMPGFGADSLLTSGLKSWVPARSIIDWSIPTQLIDNRKKPLAPKTMRRIMQGIEKYWGDEAKPFITRYNGGENRNHSIDDPMPVLDTSNRYGLVEPLFIPQHSCGTVKPVSNPLSTIATAGAIGLVQPFIASIGQTSSKNRCRSLDDPLPTIVTKQEHCLVQPMIVKFAGNNNCESIDNPLSSVRTSGSHHGLVEPLLMEYYGNGQCKPVSQPVGTVTTKERFALLEHCRVGIGFRMLQPHELAAAQSFPKEYQFTGNKTEVVKQIGNAVCPNVAEALAEDSFRIN